MRISTTFDIIGGTFTFLRWISRVSRPACSRFLIEVYKVRIYACVRLRTRARSSPLAADIRYINSGVRTGRSDKSRRTDDRRRLMTPRNADSPRRFIQLSCVIRCAREKKKKNGEREEWRTWRAAVGEWSRRSCTNTRSRLHTDARTDTDGHRVFPCVAMPDPVRAALR